MNCSGESCIAIFITFGYWILWSIAYLPYLLIETKVIKSKAERVSIFYLPSLIALILLLLSNFDMFKINFLLLVTLVIPNLILQLFFDFYYRKKNHFI